MSRSIRITLRRQLRRQTCCAYALLLILCAAGFAQTKSDAAADLPEARILADFGDRVRKYLQSRQKAGGSPKPAKEPEKLANDRKQTAAKVRVARTDAKQGDTFTPEITEYFRQQITATFAGPEGPKIRASLRRAEPVRGIPLKVNAAYPAALPRQSTPPTLLLNLPRLPKDLEYRIVGRDLALHARDFSSTQNMVVGKDTERGFMIVEIAGDNLYFQTISRVGETIDSGTVARQAPAPTQTSR